jgi:integrase
MLTDVALKALIKAPPPRQTDIPDAAAPGLSARVTPKGRVTWSLRLRVAGEGGQSERGHRAKGNQYRLTLGSYPAVTIKQSRLKAAEYGRKAEEGSHPVRALERQAVARHDTVQKLADTFLTDYAVPNLRSWQNAKSALTRHIVPAWAKLPVDAIDEREVARLLTEIAKGEVDPETGKRVPRPGAAGEVRKWGSLLFSWAVRSGLAEHNPFLKSRNPIRLKPRQRFLDMDEVRAIWKAAGEMDRPWREMLQLLLLTGCRSREIGRARWSWINEIESRLVIPAEVYKTERPFLVALPIKAKNILEQIPRWNEGDYVFSSRNGAAPVWGVPRKIVNRLHKRAEEILGREIAHFVVHDFRRTVRTHLARLKVPEVVAELVLGHALRGIAGTYNVYDFEAEKRDALARWAEELTR